MRLTGAAYAAAMCSRSILRSLVRSKDGSTFVARPPETDKYLVYCISFGFKNKSILVCRAHPTDSQILDFGGLQAYPTFYILLHNQDSIYYTTKLSMPLGMAKSIDTSSEGNYNAKSLIFSRWFYRR